MNNKRKWQAVLKSLELIKHSTEKSLPDVGIHFIATLKSKAALYIKEKLIPRKSQHTKGNSVDIAVRHLDGTGFECMKISIIF